MEHAPSSLNENAPPSNASNDLAIGTYMAIFFFCSWVSIFPASTFIYFILNIPGFFFNPIIAIIFIIIALLIAYLLFILFTWIVARAFVFITCRGKSVPEGKFSSNYETKEWRNFAIRHVVKKFSMWVFQHHVPHWLYRKYVGSFIKLGKNVEIPEWVAMELAEVGDNTVFARQTVLASHVIDGSVLNVKKTVVGKNCIIDADDETKRVVIMPGSVIEDNVIIKPGTYVAKGSMLKAGGIYQGDFVLERIGEITSMQPEELNAYRESVRNKREMKSRMITDWASFNSPWPRIIYRVADILGYICAISFIAMFLMWLFPMFVSCAGITGTIINILLLPAILFVSYGFYLYIPLPLLAKIAGYYGKRVPVLPDDPGAKIIIDDQDIVENWRKCKWLKWQIIDRINKSLFLDTSMLIYQRIGKNNVAFKTVLYNAKLDTDYISVGENTVLSFGCHIYAYTMEKTGSSTRLTLKRTNIGKNCILGSAIINAGAKIGDNVVLGFHTVVPADAILESGKTYAGNPAMEFGQFLDYRKKLKEQRGSREK